MHDGIGLVSSNVDCLIKSKENIRPLNLSFSLANINGKDVSLGPINVPSSDPVHPSYPDLVYGSTALAVPSYHSYPFLARTYWSHVHGDEVLQLMDADFKSLMPDLCHLHPLTSEEEDLASRPTQAGSLIDPFFNNPNFSTNIFARTSSDFPTYPAVDPTNPPEFDDPPFRCLGMHQEV